MTRLGQMFGAPDPSPFFTLLAIASTGLWGGWLLPESTLGFVCNTTFARATVADHSHV